MGYARVHVSFELLREVLCFPPLTEIKLVAMASGPRWDLAELTITHPDLKDYVAPEGELPPLITPTFRKQEPVAFVDWGQEET